MILTVCSNPSIDCTVELNSLNVGKLNRIENKIITYSGKALNVAIGASRLGGDAVATGFMFSNDSGQFTQTLLKEGVPSRFVSTPGHVRINYKIIDKRSMMTEINDKGELVPEDKQEELLALVARLSQKASIVVISGSIPQGINDDFYLRMCKRIPENVKIVLDSEGEKFTKALSSDIYMVKPNLYELESYTKTKFLTKRDMVEGAKRIINTGVKKVLLSLGSSGAILTDGKTHLHCKSTNVAINSTVGAGDSMLAAACVMTERGLGDEEVLRCAVAAGTASITTPGTNLFYKDKYEEIYDRLTVERLFA